LKRNIKALERSTQSSILLRAHQNSIAWFDRCNYFHVMSAVASTDPLPKVLLVGAQKAGTSAIADWLFEGGFQRPQVFEDEPDYYSKEVHFFDVEHRYQQGLHFYAQRFPNGEGMDATPDTLPLADRVYHIYQAAGGDQAQTVKILVILREPVSRELSLYNHLAYDCRHLPASQRTSWHDHVLDKDGKIMSFDDYVRETSLPALARTSGPGQSTRHGLYARHFQKWLDHFDRSQILVLSYDELVHHPKALQDRIQRFLGRVIPGALLRANSNDNPDKVRLPSCEARDALLEVFLPENEKLYQLLESHPGPPMEQSPFPPFRLSRCACCTGTSGDAEEAMGSSKERRQR
jgi:Sulfotransferase domain